jgi:diguanylate cyclase (GGDEF)-like protein
MRPLTPSVVRDELVSLEERLGLLLPVRACLTVAVAALAVWSPGQIVISAGSALALALAYLGVALVGELLARAIPATRVTVHRLLVVADVVVLFAALVPSGPPQTTAALLVVPLVAVTLLASLRSGVRVALWATGLLLAVRARSFAGLIDGWRGGQLHPGPLTGTIMLIVALWGATLCAGWFGAVKERELRRAKRELGALSDMAVAMETVEDVDDILDALLAGVEAGFAPVRAVVLWDGDGVVHLRRRGPGPAAPVPHSGWADQVATTAWTERVPVPVRALDAAADPVLSSLLPGPGRFVVGPLGPDDQRRGVVVMDVGRRLGAERLPARTLATFGQFDHHVTLVLRNARLKAEQERLARRDGLTGLYNRRAFDEAIVGEVNRSARSGDPLALVILDIDHFKQVNDRRGHQAGDDLLRQVGEVLERSVRAGDVAARYGGEEFALILPACNAANAARVAEKVRSAVAVTTGLSGLTLSAGVAAMPQHATDPATLVRAADDALYRSKKDGRDRVSIFDPGATGVLDLTNLSR